LHGARTVFDLRAKETHRNRNQSIHELIEQLWIAMHQGLDKRELSGGAPFDEVTGNREGRTRESNEGSVGGGELREYQINGRRHVFDVLVGEFGKAFEVGLTREWLRR
jgi:hypothetical protein